MIISLTQPWGGTEFEREYERLQDTIDGLSFELGKYKEIAELLERERDYYKAQLKLMEDKLHEAIDLLHTTRVI